MVRFIPRDICDDDNDDDNDDDKKLIPFLHKYL